MLRKMTVGILLSWLSLTAQAAVVQVTTVNLSGYVYKAAMSIEGLDINGVLYDVTFQYGGPGGGFLGDQAGAEAAAAAINAVLPDVDFVGGPGYPGQCNPACYKTDFEIKFADKGWSYDAVGGWHSGAEHRWINQWFYSGTWPSAAMGAILTASAVAAVPVPASLWLLVSAVFSLLGTKAARGRNIVSASRERCMPPTH